MICPTCGKVGTTLATRLGRRDGGVPCLPDYVTWARGCGTSGRLSPFGGAAKLTWNFEWAAQWSLFGVTIEPCGKDLATAGGSRDRSDAIAREVFDREPPRNLPYEFLNVGGRKMSTSKGRGAAAHEIVDVVPPEQLRLLFLRPRPNHAIEFDPYGSDAIPRLFDEFDRLADATAGREVRGELPADAGHIFRYALLDAGADVAAEAAAYRPGVRAPGAPGPGPGRRHRGTGRGGEGEPAHGRRAHAPRAAPRGGPRLARVVRAGAGGHRGPPGRAAGRGRVPWRGPAGVARRARHRRGARGAPRRARPGRG